MKSKSYLFYVTEQKYREQGIILNVSLFVIVKILIKSNHEQRKTTLLLDILICKFKLLERSWYHAIKGCK